MITEGFKIGFCKVNSETILEYMLHWEPRGPQAHSDFSVRAFTVSHTLPGHG